MTGHLSTVGCSFIQRSDVPLFDRPAVKGAGGMPDPQTAPFALAVVPRQMWTLRDVDGSTFAAGSYVRQFGGSQLCIQQFLC